MAESRTFPYTACMLLPNYEPTMVMVTHYADPGSSIFVVLSSGDTVRESDLYPTVRLAFSAKRQELRREMNRAQSDLSVLQADWDVLEKAEKSHA